MPDDPRFRLMGKYRTPRFKYGAVVMDEARGEVVIVGLSDAPMAWPIGKRGRAKSLVVFQDLAAAIRRESNQAVCYWWGITPQTVSKWRKALGVDIATEGTSRLHRIEVETRGDSMRALIRQDDSERCRKIAASKIGKKRPPHVLQALRRANIGRKLTAETRRKISEASKRRGARPPKAGRAWTAEEDALLQQFPPKIVAEKTGL